MFDSVTDRRHSGSIKWDVADHELPMWIADMDFPAAPCIRRAIEYRAAHGVFGYSYLPKEWAQAYVGWWQRRHDFTMQEDWLIFCTGIVPAISSAVRKLTTPAENVLLMPPVYNYFYNSILNNGRRALECPLLCIDGSYSIDWENFERCLADPQTSLFILCNPHNPTGNIWTAEEMARIGTLCARYGVTVISDEIHGDITDPGISYTPFASVSDTCRDISITCLAPTKTFNIAGLHSAAVCVPNPQLRHKMWRGLNTDEVAEPNAFAVDATIAAFNEGAPWLDELRAYLFANKQIAREFLATELPQVGLTISRATYLLWLDVSAYGRSGAEIAAHIRRETGLYLAAGTPYGGAGEHCLRLNIACPRSTLQDGLRRLRRGLESLG